MYNFQKKYPYYADNGITATSANYIANLGKECYRTILKELDNVTFYTTDVTVAGQEGSYVLQHSISADDFNSIPEKLRKIYTINALIAWLREAIKTREAMLDQINDLSSDDYAKIVKESAAEIDSEMEVRKTELKNWISVRDISDIDRKIECDYLYEMSLLTEKAAKDIGNSIMEIEKFGGKTTSLEDIATAETKVSGAVPTRLTTDLDTLRGILNTLKELVVSSQTTYEHLRRSINEDDVKATNRFVDTVAKLQNKKKAYVMQMYNRTKLYKVDEKRRVSQLRIVIPDSLRQIFDELNTLHNTQRSED